jgi:hypothetical protein
MPVRAVEGCPGQPSTPAEADEGVRAMQVRQRGPRKAPASKVRVRDADEDERLLVERVKVSDHEAFEALFHRYFSTVY